MYATPLLWLFDAHIILLAAGMSTFDATSYDPLSTLSSKNVYY